jgi:hypothetical protein
MADVNTEGLNPSRGTGNTLGLHVAIRNFIACRKTVKLSNDIIMKEV